MARHRSLPYPIALLAVTVLACGDGSRAADADSPRAGAPAETPMLPVTVTATHPHDADAYTQGLVWHDGWLYEGTGLYGSSSLRRVDLATGAVARQVALDGQYFGEGIAILGDRIYQLTWQEGTAFVYDRATFAVVDTFTYEGEGWGLATDGESLIMSDGTSRLRFLDPATFAVRRTVEVSDHTGPVKQLNELEWVDGEIWANVWRSRYIARIDPATGKVKAWLDLSELPGPRGGNPEEDVLNGIAWDPAGKRLFVTGKRWTSLYEIRVAG